MPKQAIIFVTHVFSEVREGPAIYARYLYEYFSKHDEFDFHIVTPDCAKRASNVHQVAKAAGSYRKYAALQDAALELAASLPDAIIHGNYAHGMWKFKDHPAPVILQVNDYDPAEILENMTAYLQRRQFRRIVSLLWRRRHEKSAVRNAQKVICNSGYTRDSIARNYTLEAGQCQVIYKAVDLRDFSGCALNRAPFSSTSAEPVRLLFVGSNWRRKGLRDLVLALGRIKSEFPRVELDIVGPDPLEVKSVLHEEIAQAGVESNLVFSGQVQRSELVAHYERADLFVLPSHYEALGVVLLEAMASGVPFVAASVGGIPEVVGHSKAGKLVPPASVGQLGDAVIALLNSPEAMLEMRNAGIVRAQDFGVQGMCRSVEALYRTMASNR